MLRKGDTFSGFRYLYHPKRNRAPSDHIGIKNNTYRYIIKSALIDVYSQTTTGREDYFYYREHYFHYISEILFIIISFRGDNGFILQLNKQFSHSCHVGFRSIGGFSRVNEFRHTLPVVICVHF